MVEGLVRNLELYRQAENRAGLVATNLFACQIALTQSMLIRHELAEQGDSTLVEGEEEVEDLDDV